MLYPDLHRVLCLLFSILISASGFAQPAKTIDLANVPTNNGGLLRVYGHTGNGESGVPVAGGFDIDGDGFKDYAMAAMRASPNNRAEAGEVYLIFGDGSINGTVDTSQNQARVLTILGAAAQEHAGSEIWMDDVTGDNIGDLLICRQDYTTPGGVIGAGALTIIKGGSELRTFASNLVALDLAAPPAAITLTTLIGADIQDRLCMWSRTGDATGDGIADIVVGADQAGPGAAHHGEVYLIRGGPHLVTKQTHQTINLASFGTATPPLNGHLLRINPPPGVGDYHLGATVQLGDLDANNRAEVMIAAALARAGGALGPFAATEVAHGSSQGTLNGTLYIVWDDNIPSGNWPPNHEITLNNLSGSQTTISGNDDNDSFAEEILAGLDYDDDGTADLFVGDLTGFPPQVGSAAGIGDVFFNAAALKGLSIVLNSPPGGLQRTRFYGPGSGAISADTATHGDFNGDGIDDLAFSSPHDSPLGRFSAGTLHVFFGKAGGWPDLVDLRPEQIPAPSLIAIAEIYGANAQNGSDSGDILAYSGAAGDINDDGLIDIIVNEMEGNGIAPGSVDVGNLIILSGEMLQLHFFKDQFESP